MAKPSTIARRKRAAMELASGGGENVQRRYKAARTANDPPGSSVRVGSDSNLLYNGWFLRQNPAEGAYTINVPANRLDPATFGGGLGALQRWVDRLVTLIPALTGQGVLEDDGFVRAVGKSNPVQVLSRGAGWTWSDVGKIGRAALNVARSGGLY